MNEIIANTEYMLPKAGVDTVRAMFFLMLNRWMILTQMTSVILSFILAMVLHPKPLLKAQAEIDHVCHDRLPNFEDYDSLPYVEAIYREVLRWAFVTPEGQNHSLLPVVHALALTLPSGVPHASTEDDLYEGYSIPTGSIVVPNTW